MNKEEYLLIDGNKKSISNLEEEILEFEGRLYNQMQSIREDEEKLIWTKTYLREHIIKKQFNKFLSSQTENTRNAVYLNNGLLRYATKSYFDDIHRYKYYSGSKWASYHKQAAYTIKWLVKFKPIQIREEYDNEKSLTCDILDINLIFALVCGFAFLNRDIFNLIIEEKDKIDKNNKTQGQEKKSFYDNLLYTLRYRSFTGKQLVSIFEALEMNLNT